MSKTIIGWSVLPLPLPGAMHTKFLYSFEDTTEGADYEISGEMNKSWINQNIIFGNIAKVKTKPGYWLCILS